MSSTRFFAGLGPSCFTLKTWWTRAIHQSYIGNHLLARIWKGADAAMFDSREGALPGFAGLKPDTQIFWCSGPIGLIPHDDFWDVVARNMRVYRRDLGFLEDNAVVLEHGEKVPADIVFCGTGWVRKYPFLTEKQVIEFGLPHSPEDDPKDVARTWESLLEIADRDVLSEFFKLKDPPLHGQKPSTSTPSRTYNGIVPLTDDSIVFAGNLLLSNAFRAAEAQAIWITAYLPKHLQLPEK